MIPLPYVTSEDAGWERGLLSPSKLRLAPRTGFALSLADERAVIRGGYGVFLNQWAYSVQTAFSRNLPFFYTKQVDVPADLRAPSFQTRNILTVRSDRRCWREHHGPRLRGRVHADVERRAAVPRSLPSTMVEAMYMGSWTLGADNGIVRNVPEPGPGSIQARRPIPQLGLIRSIRFDGKSIYHGLTLRAEQRLRNSFAFNVNYTLSSSIDDASSPGATEAEVNLPQNVHNIFDETGEWAHSSFDHRHLFVASALYQFPQTVGGKTLTAVLGGWRLNTVVSLQSGAPFTVNLGVDRANIGAGPAQRPDQLRDPNLPSGERGPNRWFDTTAFALQAPFTFGSAPRNSVIGPGFTGVDLVTAKTWTRSRHTAARVPLGDLQRCSTPPTSISRTGRSARRTSAASSAPRTRAKCNSARVSLSEARVGQRAIKE